MHGDELGPVREGRLDLHVVNHLGDALHDLIALQHLGAGFHQLSHAPPIAAPSTTKSVMSATASGWLSRRPRSSRRRATIAAVAISSLSFSRGVRFIPSY